MHCTCQHLPAIYQTFRFPGHEVKALIHDILVSKLSDQTYRIDASSKMTKEIADEIKNRLKALELPRYCEHAFPHVCNKILARRSQFIAIRLRQLLH